MKNWKRVIFLILCFVVMLWIVLSDWYRALWLWFLGLEG